jgi:hypothetical protein
MLVKVTARRTYTSGPLTGYTVTAMRRRVERQLAPRVGTERQGATERGDTYIERVTAVVPFNAGNDCGC